MESNDYIKDEWICEFEKLFIKVSDRKDIRSEIENFLFMCTIESVDGDIDLPKIDHREFAMREQKIIDRVNHVTEVNANGMHMRYSSAQTPVTDDLFADFCKCVAKIIYQSPNIFEKGCINGIISIPPRCESNVSDDLKRLIQRTITFCVSDDVDLVKVSITFQNYSDNLEVSIIETQSF